MMLGANQQACALCNNKFICIHQIHSFFNILLGKQCFKLLVRFLASSYVERTFFILWGNCVISRLWQCEGFFYHMVIMGHI